MTFPKKIKKTILVLSIFLLMLFYFFQISAMSQKMNNIAFIQKRINYLENENKKLEFSIMNSNSILNIDSLARDFEFEKIVKVQYLNTSENIMAAK